MLDDYLNGDLQNIYSKIQKYQYIFIYLYSHWDAKSLLYKSLFSQLACEFRHKINFQAVNCFYGECRDHFKLIKYPHLLINIKDVGTYSYKGPFEYFYLKNYLTIIQKPLRIIDTFEDLFKFITKNDNVLIGNFDFNSKIENEYFMTFYKSSLHSIHSDFESPIGYGVVLNQTLLDKLQLHIDLKKRHNIMFFSSFGFKNSLLNLKNANVDNLDKWIRRSINKSIDWLYPDKYQIKSDKNRLMIFVERENIYNYEIRNEKFYSTAKYLMLKSRQSCGHIQESTNFFKQYIEYLENNFIRDTCLQNNPILANLEADRSNLTNSNFLCTFQENTNIFFVDFKLYSNYAVQLLGQNFIDKKFELPLVLLVDNKNQSVFKLSGHFSFENLNQFFQNQTYYKNTQVKRMRKTLGKHSKRLKNLLEIDSKELEDFSKFRDKDVLVFYFNNWCGFCNLVNYYLLDIAQKYFSNIDSFLILKIDVDSNDLKWEQTFYHLPTLVFIPAFWTNKKESILYNYANEFIIVILYISISFITLNDLSKASYLVPLALFFVLANLICLAYSPNRIIPGIFIVFIILILYSSFEIRKEQKFYKSLTNLFEAKSTKYETLEISTEIKRKKDLFLGPSAISLNIFFVETNLQHEYFTSKQVCAIESAAFHNPNSKIFVYSIKADFQNKNLLKSFKNIFVIKFIPEEIFSNTPLWDWWLSGKVFNSTFMIAHLSDAARLALLWKYGGFYSDLDTITIKNYDPLVNYSGAGFINGLSPSLANGVMNFRKSHPFLKLVMENFANDYNPKIWGHNGPTLLRKMMAKYCNVENVYQSLYLLNRTQFTKNINDRNDNCDIFVYPQEYFYPYNNYQLKYLFESSNLNVTAFIKAYSVHFYGKVSTKYKVDFRLNNIYEHFASSNCEITYLDLKEKNNSFI
ncbi:unnamed protein product [Brachionus calyciflorus]|uniref:Alpha-1,4-N-acetylglucosaminyltransferase n=1 Tax=Brachionus calyciflorus TaxID=104777 RepID=A0A813ULI1_9BILA|nr:unnamed protein product [Brachionus calyciflorus]